MPMALINTHVDFHFSLFSYYSKLEIILCKTVGLKVSNYNSKYANAINTFAINTSLYKNLIAKT